MLSQEVKPKEVISDGEMRERMVGRKKGKEDYKTKPISFKREYWNVYDYLMKQGNASRYVIDLIIADMEKAEHGEQNSKQGQKVAPIDDEILAGAEGLLD